MILNLTETHLYIAIIVVLMGAQMYQQKLIRNLQKESKDIWDQIGILVIGVSNTLSQVEKDLSNKKDKE